MNHSVTKERLKLLRQIEASLERPLIFLGFVWLALLVVQFIYGTNTFISAVTYIVWAIFVVDFLIRIALAPLKLKFLRRNWLVALSLLLPAFSLLRIGRILAMLPSWQVILFRLLAGMNRTVSVLGSTMRRRGIGYVVALSVVVTIAGAAGMYALEPHAGSGNGIPSYGYSLWWTAMIMTTLGSSYFPVSWGGRILCFLLSLFAFSMFGYVTAAVASFFVNKDADDKESQVPSAAQLDAVLKEIRQLRSELGAQAGAAPAATPPPDGAGPTHTLQGRDAER